ncbi:MAG: bifunctional phosphopantothenoylcysteine decarboxylase/phosphopantothenate--cysteine ligase CoaBC [Deltaproteobacteria bacterium]|nr:bifunctional phosphopantothenoylcysteine decarboxylase/phosphopantothenate--cysteine ligase CoaBC [Deltaproteobacteria bacterium]
MSLFTGKNILFGVTGGIAAYKAVDWVRSLGREGAKVTVVQTAAGAKFITPLTFAVLSGNQVHSDIFSLGRDATIPHIDLANNCDLLIIAPATAATIAKLAGGIADNLLTNIALATKAKIVIFPAMNSNMYLHPATQCNLDKLQKFKYIVVPPEYGMMACNTEGPGRLPEWQAAREYIAAAFCRQDLEGIRFLITAGPTCEDLDPVRFLSNRSSGKMGYALARVARQRGAEVVLVSGPCHLPPPPGIEIIKIRSALEMYEEVHKQAPKAHIIIKAAAVADYRPIRRQEHKIKKGGKNIDLPLTANKDVLKSLGKMKGDDNRPILVGFAAESENHLAAGREKLKAKNLDLIVVNDIASPETGFAAETNQVTIIDNRGSHEKLPLLSKEATARLIIARAATLVISTS